MKQAITTKPFQKRGVWTEKKTISTVVICVCGGKYIKTRDKQILCIKCIYTIKK